MDYFQLRAGSLSDRAGPPSGKGGFRSPPPPELPGVVHHQPPALHISIYEAVDYAVVAGREPTLPTGRAWHDRSGHGPHATTV